MLPSRYCSRKWRSYINCYSSDCFVNSKDKLKILDCVCCSKFEPRSHHVQSEKYVIEIEFICFSQLDKIEGEKTGSEGLCKRLNKQVQQFHEKCMIAIFIRQDLRSTEMKGNPVENVQIREVEMPNDKSSMNQDKKQEIGLKTPDEKDNINPNPLKYSS